MKKVKKLLSSRKVNTHKGDYGKVAIIAGSKGMTGAPYLSSKSALRTGIGLVYSLVPEALELVMSIKLTEAIIKPIYDRGTGHFVKESVEDILTNLNGMDAIALGPGLGVDEDKVRLVEEVIRRTNIPMVIDADGLNCISKNIGILKGKKAPVVLTPHLGEMSRLLDKDIKEIKENKQLYAKQLAKDYNLVVVLKDNKTIVSNANGEIYINNTGNPGMATAGSGDVLTGIITSLIGQGLEPFEAAKLGVYLHGLSGDIAESDKGEYGLIASDIMEAIPYGIKKYMGNSLYLMNLRN